MLFAVIDFMPIERVRSSDAAIRRFQALNSGKEYFINSHSAKGIVAADYGDDNPVFIFDEKTQGYPQVNFVGTLMISGGNWNNRKDGNPLALYKRELSEELKHEELVRRIDSGLYGVGDYMFHVPAAVHGNMKKGDICGHASIFASDVSGSDFDNALGISHDVGETKKEKMLAELRKAFKESNVGVVSLEELSTKSSKRFGFADDRIITDFLLQRYGVFPVLDFFNPIYIERMPTDPLLDFKDRQTIAYDMLNPLRVGDTEDSKVFVAEPPRK